MKIVLMLSFIPALLTGMAPAPLAVVSFDRYTLVGNDGKEVVLEGDLVRAYLPGLADKFRAGMIEGQTGKIRVNDLDGQALANLKSLILRYHELYRDIVRQKEQLSQTLSVEEYLNREASLNKILKQQMSLKLENLPEIGDHFIALFKEMIAWDMPTTLEEAMAGFAVRYVDITTAHELLKNIDPQAQLLYLNEAEVSVDSIVKTLEWIVELENNPLTQGLESFALIEKARTKVIDFIIQNMRTILVKNPDFKNLFEKPEFRNIGNFLKQELLKKMDSNLFTTVVRPARRKSGELHYRPFVSSLGGEFIALRDAHPQNNIYNWKSKTFKSSPELKKSVPEMGKPTYKYLLMGSDLLIQYGFSPSISIYDLNTGQRIFNSDLNIGFIEEVLWSDHEIILVKNNQNLVYTFRYDRQNRKFARTSDISHNVSGRANQESLIGIFLINKYDYILVKNNFLNRNTTISLYRIDIEEPIKEIYVTGNFVSPVRKISNNTLGGVILSEGKNKYLKISIPDLEITSNDFPLLPNIKNYIPITFEYIFLEIEDKLSLYNVVSQTMSSLVGKFNSPIFLDKNHIAAFDRQSNNFVIQFIPQTSTVSEILAELQKKLVPVQVQPKRAAEQEPERPVPAAAQGVKPEAKRPREEKDPSTSSGR